MNDASRSMTPAEPSNRRKGLGRQPVSDLMVRRWCWILLAAPLLAGCGGAPTAEDPSAAARGQRQAAERKYLDDIAAAPWAAAMRQTVAEEPIDKVLATARRATRIGNPQAAYVLYADLCARAPDPALHVALASLLCRWRSPSGYLTESAVAELLRAEAAGYTGAGHLEWCDRFDRLRDDDRFAALLARMGAEPAPQTTPPVEVHLPEDAAEAPPVLVVLAPQDAQAADCRYWGAVGTRLGMATVLVSGPVVLDGSHFAWPPRKPRQSEEYLGRVLDRELAGRAVDRSRTFLLGFSQGGFHAVATVAHSPGAYAGVVAVSPLETVPFAVPTAVGDSAPPLFVVAGRQEGAQRQTRLNRLLGAWQSVGWPRKAVFHSEPQSLSPAIRRTVEQGIAYVRRQAEGRQDQQAESP